MIHARRALWVGLLLVSLAAGAFAPPASAQRPATFLDQWLADARPLHVGRRVLRHRITGARLELLWASPHPDPAIHAYRHKTTGEAVFYRKKALVGGKLMLQKPDGGFVSVPADQYEPKPAYRAVTAESKPVLLVLDDYVPVPAATRQDDAAVFVPVYGPLMFESACARFEEAMARLGALRPACVVVLVDSEGGRIDLAERMVRAIQGLRNRRVPCLAYVQGERKGAYSAAALVCLACEGIVMSPRSVMGAATPIAWDPVRGAHDLKGDVRAKTVSAFSARFRTLAAGSGFPPALAAAMVEKERGAVEVTQGARRRIVGADEAADLARKAASSGAPFAQRTICPKGTLLTITAEEARRLGAIRGLAETPAELARFLPRGVARYAIYDPVDKFLLQLQPVFKEVQQLSQRLSAALGAVAKSDPVNFRYVVDRRTRRFTPSSRRQWRRQVEAHLRHVNECIGVLDAWLALIGKHEGLFASTEADYLRSMRDGLRTYRASALRMRTLTRLP